MYVYRKTKQKEFVNFTHLDYNFPRKCNFLNHNKI